MKQQSFAARPFAAALALALGSAMAQAHPGHGLHDASATHILTSPYHLAVLALSGAALLLVARFVQRRLPRRVLQGAGLAALATATVLWGMRI
jgi:peptidoglycan/LPS O-acetylase OafA/YrhL